MAPTRTSAAFICFGISAACSPAAASGKTSNLRFGLGLTGTTLTQESKRAENACFRGWAPTCQDDPDYISRFGLNCEGHGFFQCELFLDLGFTPQEVSDLINSCPCSCSINCSDNSWKAVIGLDRLDEPKETTKIDAFEESRTLPTTTHPTQTTKEPSIHPTTASPTFVPSTLMPSSTPTNKPSPNPTSRLPAKYPTVVRAEFDNSVNDAPSSTLSSMPTDPNKQSALESSTITEITETNTRFPIISPDSTAPTASTPPKPVESTGQSPHDPQVKARAEVPNADLAEESDELQNTQNERTDTETGGSMTLSLMDLILICIGMVAITLTLLVAHGVYRRNEAMRVEENCDLELGENTCVHETPHLPGTVKKKKKKKMMMMKMKMMTKKKNRKSKNRKSRTITRIVQGLGGAYGKKRGDSLPRPVIKEGAAVFIASSTKSRCNHEALLVESFSSVSDSQASTLRRKRGPHKRNNRVQVPRDICDLPNNFVLEAE